MHKKKSLNYIHIYLSLLLCIAFIVSVVVYPKLSITVPSYLLVYLFAPVFIWRSYFDDQKLLKELFQIGVVFIVLNLLAQLHVYVFSVSLNPSLRLTDMADPGKTLLRSTLFGQTIYLFAGILCYLYLKYYATTSHIRYLYIGLRILVVLGFLEFILFQLTGVNGDLITNRVFNNKPGSGSLFQTITLGGHRMQRIKSLTGEPSMFAFSLVPFWILCIPLKRYLDFGLFGLALLLSFSTSAYLGMIILIFGACVADRRLLKPMLYILPVCVLVLVGLYFFSPAINKLVHSVFIDKFSGTNQSGSERSGYFLNQFNFWKDQLNVIGKFIGIGFGYVRSTDFLSTLLVNNGIIGVCLFTWFYFKHAFVRLKNVQFKKYYVISLVATFLILMGSVPEFAYLSLWILLSLPFWIERTEVNA
jgi:hypothetical protein